MKHLPIITMFIFLSCSDEHGLSERCVDPMRLNEQGICTLEFEPVCGCNGVTYGNACAARNAGVLHWEKGACR